jgi:hypothetical protein
MQTWEYARICFSDTNESTDEAMAELDEAGAEGWELVSVIHQPGGLDLATGHALQGVNRYFLKRPRPNLIDAN